MLRVLAWLCLAWPPSAAAAEPLRLTVYHTNDIHGGMAARPASFHAEDAARRIGGFAALAALLRKDTGPKLLLDGGDWFQGTPEGTLTQGRAVVDAMNRVGYDAVVVGNHDFDIGQDRLRELIRMSSAAVLGANIYEAGTGARADYLRPFVLKDFGPARVGIFGLLSRNTPRLSFARNIRGLSFRREVDEARDMVRELRRRGATVIIAVTHMGFERGKGEPFVGDQTLAARVPGIDLIVGGHTHTFLDAPYRDRRNKTLVVQAGTGLSRVGEAVLELDPQTGRVLGSRWRARDLWLDETGEAQDLLALVQRYESEVGPALDVVVGTAAESLTRDRFAESTAGDWMTDCTREWAGTDLAFQNSGGIRADVPAGPVTLRRLFEIMPFDNAVVTMTLTGRQVRALLEQGVSGGAGLLQVSGLRFFYRGGAGPGGRVEEIWIGDRPAVSTAGYTAAAADFIVEGGDGYGVFAQAAGKRSTETLLRDVLGWCARRGPLRAAPRDRIMKR